jgi:hypothetical protein
VSQCRGGLAPAASLDRRSGCSGGECLGGVLGAVRGDGWVLGLAGGDDGVQVPQDRGGDHGLRRVEYRFTHAEEDKERHEPERPATDPPIRM